MDEHDIDPDVKGLALAASAAKISASEQASKRELEELRAALDSAKQKLAGANAKAESAKQKLEAERRKRIKCDKIFAALKKENFDKTKEIQMLKARTSGLDDELARFLYKRRRCINEAVRRVSCVCI